MPVDLLCVHFELGKGNLFEVFHLLVELAFVDLAEAVKQGVRIHGLTIIMNSHRLCVPKLAIIVRDIPLDVRLII